MSFINRWQYAALCSDIRVFGQCTKRTPGLFALDSRWHVREHSSYFCVLEPQGPLHVYDT